MADIKKGLKKIWYVEYSGMQNKALHKNAGETGLTYKGIYQTAHPTWEGWSIINTFVDKFNGDLESASLSLFNDETLEKLVEKFYKMKFWDRMRLDKINSQCIAEEMFVFGVNVGNKIAIQAAQKVVGTIVDGIIGPITIDTINKYDEKEFSSKYDIEEIAYYTKLVGKNPKFTPYLNGWVNRANTI